MDASDRHPVEPLPARPQARSRLPLIAILAAFACFRAPFVLKQLGGHDEQYFAVPGLTVAREGIPRIPYYAARNPDSFFDRADEALLFLPPALFYLQAPFFLALSPGYPAARWPCFLAGAITIWLLYELTRRAAGRTAGLWAAGLYALSRVLFFSATIARPDQPCAAFGLAAYLFVWNYSDTRRLRWITAAGVCLGLALLCHPFAVVMCLVCGLWTLFLEAPLRRRLTAAVLLAASTLVIFAIWTPLILAHRDVFEHQFFNNVVNRAGPGLPARLLWPWPYVGYQLGLLIEQAGPWQTALMLIGLVLATSCALRRSASRAERCLVAMIWGSLYLMIAFQGRHYMKTYWCFTGALLFAAVGSLLAELFRRLERRPAWMRLAAAGLVLAILLPQSGLRLWLKQIVPAEDDRYHGPRFTQRLIAALPTQGRFLVEPDFVFDVWLTGRNVGLRETPDQFQVERLAYDWLVVGRDAISKEIPKRLDGELVRSLGSKDDPFACYAEVYRPQAIAEPSRNH
jgi:hypothetical protein